MGAESLVSLGGVLLVAMLHTLIPSHWLCFTLVGRGQNWSLKKTLAVTALAGTLHVLSTVALGVIFVLLSRELIPSGILLIVLGLVFILLQALGKGHHHDHDLDRVATAALILGPTFSPCTILVPMFPGVAQGGTPLLILLGVLLLVTTLATMLALVALSWFIGSQMKFEFLNRYEKAIIGGLLTLLGTIVLTLHFFLPHDDCGGSHEGHDHGNIRIELKFQDRVTYH